MGKDRKLLRIGVVLLTVLLPVLALASVACTPQQVMEVQLGIGLNQLRADRGLSQILVDPALSKIARIRAEDMALKDYFSHQAPDGCDFRCLMSKNGVAVAWAGEVIAWNNAHLKDAAAMTVNMWRNSPTHYGIITGCQFTRMGTGAAIAQDGRIYHVAVFEGNGPTCQ
jgi:uncharacterized protein YkwD